jgi:peroxiredoxin
VPRLEKIRTDYRDRNVIVAGVSRSRPEKTASFAKRSGATYPLLADGEDTFEALDVRVVPETFLLDPGRKILARGLDEVEHHLERDRG